MLGFQVGNLAANQLQLGGKLLDTLGEGVAGALELVLGGFHLRQLFHFLWLFGAQGLAATEVFQGLLGIEHLLVQGFGLGLAGRAVGCHGLLGFQLLELFFQALLLVAQCRAVGQGLQRRWLDVRKIDGQPRRLEALALEAIEYRFQRFDPGVVVVQGDAMLAQGQAEQRAVEQAHQAFDILLRELLAQAGIAVVVGMVELLLDRFEAFFQVAQALFQVFGTELARLRQGTGQLVVGILGSQ
ncbi:hypothetical protein D9M71_367570 [compost metagenome]